MDVTNKIIRRLRREQSLTLKEVSERTGFSVSYISAIETGARPLTEDNVEVFAKALSGENPSTKSQFEAIFKEIVLETKKRIEASITQEKAEGNARTLSAFERDIQDSLRILRGGRKEKSTYKLLEQGGFDILDEGRTLARRSVIEVDGELFEVEFALQRVDGESSSKGIVHRDMRPENAVAMPDTPPEKP